jgi:hypothetical protein
MVIEISFWCEPVTHFLGLTSYKLLIDKPYEKHILVSASAGSVSFEHTYLLFI